MSPAQTFHDHIKELRHRILWVVLAIGASAIISYMVRNPIIRILQKPLGVPLVYTSPAGSFDFVLKLSVMIGMFIALPVMIYHLLRFIEPALPVSIKRGTVVKVIGSSFLLAVLGVCFGFFIMIPMSLHFFNSYATPQIKPLITAGEYLSFVLNHMITFAVVFQIPMVVMFINRIKPFRPSKLLKYQRHVIVGSFGIAVILPFTYDPLSQFIVAVPVVVLYYLSVILIWITNRKRVYPEEAGQLYTNIPSEPLKEPAIELAQSPQLAPARVTRRPQLIDGFVVSRSTSIVPKQPAQAIEQKTETPARAQQPTFPRPKLAIDGISPPLPSYF